MGYGALGAEAIMSPRLFAQGFSDENAANEFARLRDQRKSQLPTYKPSEGTQKIQQALLEPLISGAKQMYGKVQEKFPEETYAVGQYFDDPRVMHTLGALELGLPSGARAAKALQNRPDIDYRPSAHGTPGSQQGAIEFINGVGYQRPDPRLRAQDLQPASNITQKRAFASNLDAAREAMTLQNRAQVDRMDPDSFTGTVYSNREGTAGFSLDPTGYISHAYKAPDSGLEEVAEALMTKARAEGATRLDAIDGYLPSMYKKTGAREIGRAPWNPDYATDEMLEAFGARKPDYVSLDVGGVFDEYKHSKIIGPRDQFDLNRYETTPTGRPVATPIEVKDLLRPENMDKMMRLMDAGIEKGGDKWYHLAGVLDRFLAQKGPEEGLKAFDKFMSYGAALSPRSNVATEIKRASHLMRRENEGLSNLNLKGDQFPEGYGHFANLVHSKLINQLLKKGQIGDPQKAQKAPSYDQNKRLNYDPVTVDTHNYMAWTFDPETGLATKKSPTAAMYPYLERAQKELGQDRGLQGAEVQSSIWVGGSDITGVADPRNYTAALNRRIAKTAELMDLPEDVVTEMFIDGKIDLQ